MSAFSAADGAYMARALRLAERGLYTAHPNPRVGCVLVKDGVIVGEGFHEAPGKAHAEVNAIEAARGRANGATAYVTLEPCAHHGRTPPCTDALIAAGVAKVVVAVRDPFVDGDARGLEVLAERGVENAVGLLEEPATRLNEGFFSRIGRGRPFVRLKSAASIDGAIAMADGASQWITGAEARHDVQRWRARSGAVLTGIGTVLADDPSLTVRMDALPRHRQPLRVVLDSSLRMPLSAGMLVLPGETLVYCSADGGSEALARAGATVVPVRAKRKRVDPLAVLQDLANRGVNEVLVEAGPGLSGALLDAGLVDELVIYQAPHIMGSSTLRMVDTPAWTALGDRMTLAISDVRRVGSDLRITARPV